jgi:phosphoribosyl-ATP pyrophosphohydrolase/phosphoribosyl-AMP cyclohydrolase
MALETIQFDDEGLVPAVVQDSATGEVLMLAHMNAESLARTLQTGETWFWDPSRREPRRHGAGSGDHQRLVELRLDCDGDAVIVRVEAAGPACHTGERSCFFRPLAGEPPRPATESPIVEAKGGSPALSLVDVGSMEFGILLNDLHMLIQLREAERPENSYTAHLFNEGLDAILKKIGEEATETVIAAKNGSPREMVSGISDLFYHLLVLMVERGIGIKEVCSELGKRAGPSSKRKHAPGGREG